MGCETWDVNASLLVLNRHNRCSRIRRHGSNSGMAELVLVLLKTTKPLAPVTTNTDQDRHNDDIRIVDFSSLETMWDCWKTAGNSWLSVYGGDDLKFISSKTFNWYPHALWHNYLIFLTTFARHFSSEVTLLKYLFWFHS